MIAHEAPGKLVRYPRGFDKSPGYYPQWRELQAQNYWNETLKANAADQEFVIPDWEDDQIVMDYYDYLVVPEVAYSGDPRANQFFYAKEAVEHNARTSGSSKMRALMIAGLSAEHVADRMGSSAANIETFYSIFFDVRRYLGSRDLLSSLAFWIPEKNESIENKRDRMWMCGAYIGGEAEFDRLVTRKIEYDDAQVRLIEQQTAAMIAYSSKNHTLMRVAAPFASQMDAQNDQARLQSRKDRDDSNQDEGRVFMARAIEARESSEGWKQRPGKMLELKLTKGSNTWESQPYKLSPDQTDDEV